MNLHGLFNTGDLLEEKVNNILMPPACFYWFNMINTSLFTQNYFIFA